MNFQIQSWPTPEIFAKLFKKGFTKTFTTGITPWTNLNSATHGFGSVPTAGGAFLVCISADAGYSVGDRIDSDAIFNGDQAVSATAFMMNVTQLNLYTDDITNSMIVTAKAGGSGSVTLDPTKWDVFMWAFQF